MGEWVIAGRRGDSSACFNVGRPNQKLQPMTGVTQHLTRLETAGLIRLAQIQPELEYLFRHALIRDAAYQSLLKADRKPLHRVVAEALERLYPDRLDELAPLLGQHYS